MVHLPRSLAAWPGQDFNTTLKAELAGLGADHLPLQAGLTQTSQVSAEGLEVVVLSTVEQPDRLLVKAGLFYAGIIAGCSCADDPTPVDEITEYCEVLLTIDKATAATRVEPLGD